MAQKTEKPTDKRRRDAARKGQSFRSRDLVTSVILCCGIIFMVDCLSLKPFIMFYTNLLVKTDLMEISFWEYLLLLIRIFSRIFFPFFGVCVFSGALTTLIQTRFAIASEGLKPNLNALNPVQGFKRLFTVKTIKELVKSVCYIVALFLTMYLLFHKKYLRFLLSTINTDVIGLTQKWITVVENCVFIFIALSSIILVTNFIAEYFIHLNEMKMDKYEVKQEFKENEGNPEIKSARKRTHLNILSGEDMAAIKNSEVVIANPTHIAIAVYFNPEVALFPFIALRCTNMKAIAAINYAEQNGVPVVRNIKLARKLYNTYPQHSFISPNDELLISVMDVLIWLQQVETGGIDEKADCSLSERN
ncbi:EscU/YscU/HrcU family type III secretion system export apparatus switch protein [Salmonella enterica]|nr:EscU/YscU/HrcU family type III secretion system export apparatus switch protein [Salmonella enterica]